MAITVKSADYGDGAIKRFEMMGLSTDSKPTDGVDTNSLFLELDTGDLYYYDSGSWSKVGG